EDGIRVFHVTGVQTCALPISHPQEMARAAIEVGIRGFVSLSTVDQNPNFAGSSVPGSMVMTTQEAYDRNIALVKGLEAQERVKRSEERRVGKERKSAGPAAEA